jgi:hypothetical protein
MSMGKDARQARGQEAGVQERTELHRCYGLAIGPNAKGSLRREYSEYPRAFGEEYPKCEYSAYPRAR